MNVNKNLSHLLVGLPEDVSIDDFEHHLHSVELFVSWPEPKTSDVSCPHCGSSHCVKKDNGTMQTIRHIPNSLQGSLLTFHKPRFQCRSCKKSFYVRPVWSLPGISISSYLFLKIYEELTSTSNSIKTIADHTKTSPAIVRNVISRIRLDAPKHLPQTLGIDEFHGRTGSYNPLKKRYDTEKYHCVVTDADAGTVIDILYKATFNELKDYFMQFPLIERRKVIYFCTDLRPGFSKVARACFPNVKICLDPFHVTKVLTAAISEIRIDEWRRLRDIYRKAYQKWNDCRDPQLKEKLKTIRDARERDFKLVKNSQRILTTSPDNETRFWNCHKEEQELRLKQIFELSPDLEFAHDALIHFYQVTAESEFKLKHAAFSRWLDTYLNCDFPYIRRAAKTLSLHRTGIENAWRFHKSNSPTEGLNKKIKDVKRLAFGAHDFENFRKRALLSCGCLNFIEEPYTVFREKQTVSYSADTSGKGGDAA